MIITQADCDPENISTFVTFCQNVSWKLQGLKSSYPLRTPGGSISQYSDQPHETMTIKFTFVSLSFTNVPSHQRGFFPSTKSGKEQKGHWVLISNVHITVRSSGLDSLHSKPKSLTSTGNVELLVIANTRYFFRMVMLLAHSKIQYIHCLGIGNL